VSGPLLAILVPCMSSRPWEKVVNAIRLQTFGTEAVVRHLVDNGEMTSGQKRHVLTQMPEVRMAKYRAFVDDDDVVSRDFVSQLLIGCTKGVDVVSFNLRFNHQARTKSEVWKFGLYPNDRKSGLMCVNHLCAWKTEIADKVAWCPSLGYGDDHIWFEPLFHAGLIKTEHHINAVLYDYMFNPTVTENQKRVAIAKAKSYVGSGLKCFKMPNGSILVQDGHDAPVGKIKLRDNSNLTDYVDDRPELNRHYYHTATIV